MHVPVDEAVIESRKWTVHPEMLRDSTLSSIATTMKCKKVNRRQFLIFLAPRHDQHLAPRRHPARTFVTRSAPLAGPLRGISPRLRIGGTRDPLQAAVIHPRNHGLAAPGGSRRGGRFAALSAKAAGVLRPRGGERGAQQVRKKGVLTTQTTEIVGANIDV